MRKLRWPGARTVAAGVAPDDLRQRFLTPARSAAMRPRHAGRGAHRGIKNGGYPTRNLTRSHK
jgi:hypothetical protein